MDGMGKKASDTLASVREILLILLTEPVAVRWERVEPRRMRPEDMTEAFFSMLVYVARTAAFVRHRTALELALSIIAKKTKTRVRVEEDLGLDPSSSCQIFFHLILEDLFRSDMVLPCRYDKAHLYLYTHCIPAYLDYLPVSYSLSIQSLRDAGMLWDVHVQTRVLELCYEAFLAMATTTALFRRRCRTQQLYGALAYVCRHMDPRLREDAFSTPLGEKVVFMFNTSRYPLCSSMLDRCFDVVAIAEKVRVVLDVDNVRDEVNVMVHTRVTDPLNPLMVSDVEETKRRVLQQIHDGYAPGQTGMQRAMRRFADSASVR